MTTHGHATKAHPEHATYSSWDGMKQRCRNPKHRAYKRYGGRGIKVCDRWLNFANFLEDMGYCPAGMTLEREDNDGDYTPENCTWATRATQAKNRHKQSRAPGKGWKKRGKRFVAQIRVKGKLLWLGTYATKGLAHEAYQNAREKFADVMG